MSRHNRVRVLIADNHPDAANSLASLLWLWGYEVRVARTGSEAVEACDAFTPDVLLAEVAVPHFAGLDLPKRLRDRRTVLIALTVLGDPVSRERVQRAGYHCHLVKPMPPAFLQPLLARMARTTAFGRRHAESAN